MTDHSGPLRPESAERTSSRRTRESATGVAWWRVGMVWVVIAGPLLVVLAGLTTAVIAIRGADPVLSTGEKTSISERPAIQGRNHAATGPVPR